MACKRPRSRSRRAQKGERFGRFAPRHDSRPEWSSIGNSSHRGRWPVRCRCGFAKGAARWGRQGLRCPHCVRDDYGGQRERSGIARAAVPRRAGPGSLGTRSAAHLGVRPSFASVRFGGQASCPRRGRRRGSASTIDAGRGLTGILLRSFGSSAALAVRCSSLLPTRELKSSLYFRAGRSLPHTQAAAAPLPLDSPQATSQPAGSLVTGRASVRFGGQTSCPRRAPTPSDGSVRMW